MPLGKDEYTFSPLKLRLVHSPVDRWHQLIAAATVSLLDVRPKAQLLPCVAQDEVKQKAG